MAEADCVHSTPPINTPITNDPIYAAIEAHRAAYAAYDGAAEAPDDENEKAFRELDRASQLLMRAEASTLEGLIALLRYSAELLGEAGAPGLPIEVPFAGRWSAAFGKFCANVANSLAAIVTAGSAATPERIERVAKRSSKRPHRSSMISKWPDARPEWRSRPSHHEPPTPIGRKRNCQRLASHARRLRREAKETAPAIFANAGAVFWSVRNHEEQRTK